MKPIDITVDDQQVEIFCRHEKQWPPGHARLVHSPEQLRAAGDITEAKYQQLKVWEKTCGLFRMEEDKCSKCPLAMIHTKKGEMPLLGWSGSSRRPPFAKARPGKQIKR